MARVPRKTTAMATSSYPTSNQRPVARRRFAERRSWQRRRAGGALWKLPSLPLRPSHVYRTLARFEELGWLGLLDGRRDNGDRKTDAAFCSVVRDLLDQSPRDYGYLRPPGRGSCWILVSEEQAVSGLA